MIPETRSAAAAAAPPRAGEPDLQGLRPRALRLSLPALLAVCMLMNVVYLQMYSTSPSTYATRTRSAHALWAADEPECTMVVLLQFSVTASLGVSRRC